jgi:hypothetical protein
MPLGAFKAALMGTAGVATESVVLLSTQAGSGVSEIDFSSGIDSTYGEYIFKFYTLNPVNDAAFQFQVNATDGADYNDSAITSSHIQVYHAEDDSGTPVANYRDAGDQDNVAGFQELQPTCGNGADEAAVGELHLFNPSSTTYVKHWYCQLNSYTGTHIQSSLTAGYINDATAIDDVRFKFALGDFDGKIKMWGVK